MHAVHLSTYLGVKFWGSKVSSTSLSAVGESASYVTSLSHLVLTAFFYVCFPVGSGIYLDLNFYFPDD